MNSFKYLGIVLFCTKPFASAAVPRSETEERIQIATFSRCSEVKIKSPVLRMQLWDSRKGGLAGFFEQDQIELASFVHDCCKAGLQWVVGGVRVRCVKIGVVKD